MSAYANAELRRQARLLHLEPVASRSPIDASLPSLGVGSNASAIDAVFDCLIDRLAAAVATRLTAMGGGEDDWLDSRQAAEYLGLHRDTLRRLAAARAIPAEQDGRGCKLFFRRAALDEWRCGGGRVPHLAAVRDAA